MNEEDWLKSDSPRELFAFVCGGRWARSLSRLLSPRREQARQRNLRLYLCACVRRHWPWLGGRGRAAVEVAERFADGGASRSDLDAARGASESEAVGEKGGE